MLEPLDRTKGETIATLGRQCLVDRSIDRARGETLTKHIVIDEDAFATLLAWAERGLAMERRT